MDHSNEGYNNLFPDSSHQYHAYDPNFLNGNDHNLINNAGWGVPASNYPNASRAGLHEVPPSWQQNANHLAATPAPHNITGPAQPYQRSLSHSPAPFGQNQYGSYPQQQNFQYRQPQYDPALFNASTPGQEFRPSYGAYGNQPQNLATIAPQALQHETRSPAPNNSVTDSLNYAQTAFSQSRFGKSTVAESVNQQKLLAAIPSGKDAGSLSIIDFDQLVRATNTERMSNFLTIGKEAQEWPVNRTSTLPQYISRKSKNELRRLAGSDSALLRKIGKKSIKKQSPLSASSTAGRSLVPGKGPGSPETIKYEGDSSSSEESSDDDDASSYTSDEDLEGSPLPSKRPDHPKDAVEYDTIKALWRAKRKSVGSDDIRKGIVAFWEIVKTIRDRWKIDAAAATEAEEKKRVGELPLLNSRVKDQRDMIESAFKAALKHGHRSIVELLAENSSLLYLCYQFLLDRFKADDVNGSLSRAMLEIMCTWTTVTDETLDKTHLDKVLLRYAKKGDAKTQFYAKKIIGNATAATKAKSSTSSVAKALTQAKSGNATSPPAKRAEPEPVAGVKRSSSSAGAGGAQKKVAIGGAKSNGPSAVAKPNGIVRKAVTATDTTKPTSSATATPIVKTKQVTAKSSSFFSNLQSAAKKPGTSIKTGTPSAASGTKPAARSTPAAATTAPKSTFSFAETMANLNKPKEEKPVAKPEKELPPETAEEKAKRLRKETRRKLHVQFKLGEDLVQVRYFTHDPEEEIGHDDSQMRDMSDVGGEGRMLKLHKDMMDIDEEEEDAAEEQRLINFKPPTEIDFSVIDTEELNRNYVKFGGPNQPESEELAIREQYEASNLIIFYPDVADIPLNPREPSNPYPGQQNAVKNFGVPTDSKFAERARQRKAGRPQSYQGYAPVASPYHFAALQNAQQPAQVGQMPTQQPAVPIDIQSILASLQTPAQLQQPQPPPMMNFAHVPPPTQPNMNGMLPPQGAPDLAAILAAIQGNQQGTPQAAPMGGFGGAPTAAPMGGFMPQMQQPEMGSSAEDKAAKRWRDQGEKNKFFKTKVCRYWQEGRCMKGDGCTYLHEEPPA